MMPWTRVVIIGAGKPLRATFTDNSLGTISPAGLKVISQAFPTH
jgi:hypothetical protein